MSSNYLRSALGVALCSDDAARELLSSIGEPLTRGEVFYVCSANAFASNNNPGTDKARPLATIAGALAKVTAGRGDVILVMQGHTESLAADIDVTTSHNSTRVVGLGCGESRPILTFTATGAKVDIDGTDITWANMVHKNDVDSQDVVIDVDGAGAVIEGNDILEGSSKQFLIGIDIAASRCRVEGNYIKSVAAGANSGIKISAAVDRTTIVKNEVFGDFADACVHNPTGNVATRCSIIGNMLTNLQSGDHAIELVSACTGVIAHNIVNSSLAAAATKTAVDPGACYCIENYGHDAADDTSGILNPVADS